MKSNYIFIKTAFLLLFFITQNLKAQCTYTVTKSIAYYEDFTSVTTNNQLPACWLSSNPGVTCLTYTTSSPGSSYASFFDTPTGANYFYSEGLYLIAGVTYSASIWYKTDNTGGTNWTDLSIMYGTTQSSAGLVAIASTGGPANSAIYASLSNTFVVSSTGIYYMAIRGTSTAGIAHYLNWYNLTVELPCSAGNNTPNMTLTASTSSVCSGDPNTVLSFTASGADTYLWNSGATTSIITVNTPTTPLPFGNYEVVGTNTLSFCTATLSQNITILPSPNTLALASHTAICLGDASILNVLGATTYSWSTGSTSTQISVSPTVATSYTVVGTAVNGCTSMAVVPIGVNPLPAITAFASPDIICLGEEITLTPSGGVSYTFTSGSATKVVTTSYTSVPEINSSYTVVGKDAEGCSNKTNVTLQVNECVGLSKNSIDTSFSLFPNPNNGEFTLVNSNFNNESALLIVYNSLGQRIIEQDLTNERTLVKTNLSTGLYYYEVVTTHKKISTGKLIVN